MRFFLILILSLVLCFSVVAQTNNNIEPINIQGTELIIRLSTNSNVGIVVDKMFISFSGDERDKFLKFLDIHLTLLEAIDKNGLYDNNNRDVIEYKPNENTIIKTSLRLKDKGYISFYINNKSAYRIIYLTKQNIIDMKNAFEKIYDFSKRIDTKTDEIQKLILDARLSFKN